MSSKKYKYDGRGSHKRALLHAIGQLEEINQSRVTVGQVMGFMGVSRPTATKYLMMLADNNEIVMWRVNHRANCKKHVFALVWDIREEYIRGQYKEDYNVFVANRFGVQLHG